VRRSKRLSAIAASTVISAGALPGIGAAPASATPQFCNGNYLCANVAAQSYSTLWIHMWSSKYSFTGHFELQTPEHPPPPLNSSPDQKYYGNGSGPTFAVPIAYGKYCATAWGKTSTGYNKLGYICFTAGA
jgi:hypothetical protein